MKQSQRNWPELSDDKKLLRTALAIQQERSQFDIVDYTFRR
jgi:hypothetical protein